MKFRRDKISLACQFVAEIDGMEEVYLLPMIIYGPMQFDIDSEAGIRKAVEYIIDTIKAARIKLDYDEENICNEESNGKES